MTLLEANNLQPIKYYGTLCRYNWSIVLQFYEKSMRCGINVMSGGITSISRKC